MKVLLIPSKIDTSRFIPLGVAYLASYLTREGHNVRVLDETPVSTSSLECVMGSFQPDAVGVSCMTSTLSKALSFAKTAKSVNSDIPIIFGGIHPTAVPTETLAEPSVDYVVVGEGEITLTELLLCLEGGRDNLGGINGLGYKAEGRAVLNPPRDLIKNIDSSPFPARDLFDMNYYKQRWNWPRGNWLRTANLMSSRGCPYNCSYCASKVMFGRTFRMNSPQRTVDEVEMLVKEYGFECVSFSDDTFAVNKTRAIDIAREIKRRKLDVVYRVQLRADTSSEELVRELANSGCIHVDVGVESGSPRILRSYDKGVTIEQIETAFKTYKKHGIKSGATFIIGSPDETEEDIALSRDLARRIEADYTQFFILTPYPGTPLCARASREGLFIREYGPDDYRHGGEGLSPMLKGALSPDRLVSLRDEINSGFVDKTITNYLDNPVFVGDLADAFKSDSNKLKTYTNVLLETGSVGRALKAVMPHQL